MNAKEGVTRIAKLVSLVGWIASIAFLVGALVNVRNTHDFLALLVLALVAGLMFQGVVWIFDGFAGNKGADSALFWPLKRKPGTERRAKNESNDHLLVGVHGWLFFFVLVLMVFGPLRVLADVSTNISEAEKLYPGLADMREWENYVFTTWLLVLLVVASSMFAGYALLRHHHPSSVRTALWVLWVIPVMSLAIDFWASSYYLNVQAHEYASPQTVGTIAQSLVVAIVWSAYLKFSRRVRNTYFSSGMGARVKRVEPTI